MNRTLACIAAAGCVALAAPGCKRSMQPPNAAPLDQDPAGPPGLTPQALPPPSPPPGSPETDDAPGVAPNEVDEAELDEEETEASPRLDDEELATIVSDNGRNPDDFAADERRKPLALLRFLELRRGMRVADIGAGFGYTTELLARAVGPSGRVYVEFRKPP